MEIKMSSEEVVGYMIESASRFTSVLLAAGVDDDEAAVRGSEIALEMFKRILYDVTEIIGDHDTEDDSEVTSDEEGESEDMD